MTERDIGTDHQLFVDDFWIDRSEGGRPNTLDRRGRCERAGGFGWGLLDTFPLSLYT